MRWRAVAAAVASSIGLGVAPAIARADVAGDSLTMSPPSSAPVANQPIVLTGTGSVAGADPTGVYSIGVIFTPVSQGVLSGGCPADSVATAQTIADRFQENLAQFVAYGLTEPPLLLGGAFTWQATINGGVNPNGELTTAGEYDLCAYLVDTESGVTYAGTTAPVVIDVKYPAGSGQGSNSGFGRSGESLPPGHRLSFRISHPLRIPGRNLFRITGSYDVTTVGAAYLTVTAKSTRVYDGCAYGETTDVQLAQAGGGGVLADTERVHPSESGSFTMPLELRFKRRPRRGRYILCAYLVDGLGDTVDGGYYRFSYPLPQASRR